MRALKTKVDAVLTARRFISRTTASTLDRLEAACSNVRPIGLREPHRSAVRAVQSALADLSETYLQQAQIDGMYGPRTVRAVEALQRDYGLYADGFVGKQTLTQLDVIYSSGVLRAPVGTSLHVGVNVVDGSHYGNQISKLDSCVNDAEATAELAGRLGYTGTVLVDKNATVANVTAGIRAAASDLFAGDAFFFSFSGHGAQIPNTTSDEEPDGMDETLCLYDRMLVDDELYLLLGEFRSGVRVFLLFDSCHSATAAKGKRLVGISPKAIKDAKAKSLKGTLDRFDLDVATVPVTREDVHGGPPAQVRSAQPLTKEQLDEALAGDLNTDDLRPIPPGVSFQATELIELFADVEMDTATGPSKLLLPWETPYKGANRVLYDTVRNVVGPKEMLELEAKVVSFAACLDSQTTLAGSVLSEFTANFITVWGNGKYDGSCDQLIAQLKQFGSYNDAAPTLATYGPGGSVLAHERPFAI